MASRKPAIAWALIVAAGFFGMVNLVATIGAASMIGQRPMKEVVGTAILSLLVAIASALIVRGTLQRTFESRLPVSLYLWSMLIVYPLVNALHASGWYLPLSKFSDEELIVAALLELMRYVVLIALIIRVALSKALKAYFSRPMANVHQGTRATDQRCARAGCTIDVTGAFSPALTLRRSETPALNSMSKRPRNRAGRIPTALFSGCLNCWSRPSRR